MGMQKPQSEFAFMVGLLIKFAYSMGYEVTFGDAWAHDMRPVIDFLKQVKPHLPQDEETEKKYNEIMALLISLLHRLSSNHYNKLAIDLNLFKNGKYLDKTEDHRELGEYWESIGGAWGGRFGDGNHYSLEYNGMK